jgi:hypothetical protein
LIAATIRVTIKETAAHPKHSETQIKVLAVAYLNGEIKRLKQAVISMKYVL